MKIRAFILLMSFLLAIKPAFSQNEPVAQDGTGSFGMPKGADYSRWSAGLTFGVSHLLGDLLKGSQNNNRYLEQALVKPVYGLQVNYQLTHSIGLRGRFLRSSFAGNDVDIIDRDGNTVQFPGQAPDPKEWAVRFESPLTEGTLEMTYNFGNISFLSRNKNFHFVACLGLGTYNFDAKVYADSAFATDSLIRKSGKISELMIPFGLGFKYKIKNVDLGLSVDYRRTFTDKMDATVRQFSENDSYVMLNLGINYNFGNKRKPMEWVNPLEIVYNDISDIKAKVEVISGDKDNDGVSDLFDKDNSTPEGSKVYGDGTAVDTDGDGVIDSQDADPFTPKGVQVDQNGAEIDTDKDGVPDSKDLEPNTGNGSLVNHQGITLAKAGEFGKDGAGINGNKGSDGKDGAGYLPSVFFNLGSATITTAYQDRLLLVARVLKANPALKIKVIGNCDIIGSVDENIKLGQRRADNVKNHLVKQYGIDPARISSETKGKGEPMASNLNNMNRRVDFVVE